MTRIEWTKETWNPVRGCSRVSLGCVNCYAERMAARGLPGMKSPTTGEPFAVMTPSGPRWTGTVELIESKLAELQRWRKPRRVFVNSMSDLFHEILSDHEIGRVFEAMCCAPQHTFQILTKRADRMERFMRAYTMPGGRPLAPGTVWCCRHIWLGVSVENQEQADKRIPALLRTPAAVRFVSAEPLLSPVDLSPWLVPKAVKEGYAEVQRRFPSDGPIPEHLRLRPSIDWVIVGGESGPGARQCQVDWIRSIVRQCREARVACFVNQLGAYIGGDPDEFQSAYHTDGDGHRSFRLDDPKGGDPIEWPEDLRVREYPEVSNV